MSMAKQRIRTESSRMPSPPRPTGATLPVLIWKTLIRPRFTNIRMKTGTPMDIPNPHEEGIPRSQDG